jgi:hypothetical protein
MKFTAIAAICIILFTTVANTCHAQLAARLWGSSFKKFDANKSGWLSGKELTACNCVQYDTNADSEVTLEEFLVGKGMTRQEAKKYSSNVNSTAATPATPVKERSAVSNPVQEKPAGTGIPRTSGGPRLGKYHVLSYGSNSNPLRLGHFQLTAGGNYSYYYAGGDLMGSGTYQYEDTKKEMVWLSGPFKTYNWSGVFEISREGKTHSIRLTRSTYGSNSTDSK